MSRENSLASNANPIRAEARVRIPKRSRSDFDRVAGCYPWLEARVFGRKLENIRSQYLNFVTPRKHVLIIGEGNGRFCSALVQRKVTGSVTIVDSSRHMLAAARSRVGHRDSDVKISFVHEHPRVATGSGLRLPRDSIFLRLVQAVDARSDSRAVKCRLHCGCRLVGYRFHRGPDWGPGPDLA